MQWYITFYIKKTGILAKQPGYLFFCFIGSAPMKQKALRANDAHVFVPLRSLLNKCHWHLATRQESCAYTVFYRESVRSTLSYDIIYAM